MKIRWIISAVLIAVAVVGISFADTWMKDTGYEINGTTLDFDIWQQLHNIGATTISSTQWGYLGGQDQAVATTSAPTFATVNTGQGANELYAMNQNVRTTDSPTFAGLTMTDAISGLNYTINANSLQEGLVGYWGFEYGSGQIAYDSISQIGNITLGNLTEGDPYEPSWILGKNNKALEFNASASNYAHGNVIPEINLSTNWTISVWVKLNSECLDGEIIRTNPDSVNRINLRVDSAARKFAFLTYNGTTTNALGTGPINIHEWYHITYGINNGSKFLYLNTIPQNYGSVGTYGGGADFRLGGVTARFFNGSIDDLRIYNRALSEEEIRALYYGLGSQPTGHLALK